MKTCTLGCSLLFLVVVGCGLGPAFGAEPLPNLVIPDGLGVNIHFTGQPRDLDLIRQAGLRFIRMDLAWGGVERQKGVYGFDRAGYDDLTKGCVDRGIRILYILDYSNRLYEEDRSVRTPEGRAAFVAFAEAAANRYRGHGILWEIWNEPNIQQFWRPQPSVEDYCALVRQAAPQIRAADPSGLVVAPATSGIPMDWLEACFKEGLLEWIDVVSMHPYRPQAPETVIADYERLRRLIKQYAPDKKVPIISGEWGYSNVNWDKRPLTDEQQARYLARMYLTNLSQRVAVNIWYDWKNDGTDPQEREHNFGTVEHDLRPKTAYEAAKVLTETLGGFSFDKRLDLANPADFALQFVRGDRQAIAVWTTGEAHEVTLPVQAGRAVVVDMLGGRRETSWTQCLRIEARPNPQYLLVGE